MRKNSRIFVYILINILISTVTVLVVLWIWESTHPTALKAPANTLMVGEERSAPDNETAAPVDQDSAAAATLGFVTEDVQVSIHAIVGPGNLDVEYVEIHNQSQGSLDMTSWQITDQDGNVFTFPSLILNEGGAVKVLSKPGNNTVIELYWQSEAPIWQPGEIANLLNAQGTVIATYSIP